MGCSLGHLAFLVIKKDAQCFLITRIAECPVGVLEHPIQTRLELDCPSHDNLNWNVPSPGRGHSNSSCVVDSGVLLGCYKTLMEHLAICNHNLICIIIGYHDTKVGCSCVHILPLPQGGTEMQMK